MKLMSNVLMKFMLVVECDNGCSLDRCQLVNAPMRTIEYGRRGRRSSGNGRDSGK